MIAILCERTNGFADDCLLDPCEIHHLGNLYVGFYRVVSLFFGRFFFGNLKKNIRIFHYEGDIISWDKLYILFISIATLWGQHRIPVEFCCDIMMGFFLPSITDQPPKFAKGI